MINIIRKILGLCDHKWEILNTRRMFENASDTLPIGNRYILQCKNCGKLKVFEDYK